MKKYLLTSLLWVFALFGFASAESFTFVGAWWSFDWYYEPWTFTTDWWIISNFNTVWNWYFYIKQDWEYIYQFPCWSEDCSAEGDLVNWVSISAWTYELSTESDEAFTSVSFSISSSFEWWDSSWSLLPWWEWSLSWIITWLNSTITEFIPYLIYLWLWIITVIIWFVAIRWLVNRTQAKIRWSFSSWRRRK